jgi:hypothetical protein
MYYGVIISTQARKQVFALRFQSIAFREAVRLLVRREGVGICGLRGENYILSLVQGVLDALDPRACGGLI